MNRPTVLVTGATGFVGKSLILKLMVDQTFSVVAAARNIPPLQGLCSTAHFDLNDPGHLPELDGISVVIHTAARVHVMKETAADSLAEFRMTNVEGTLRLAKRAAASGVKRFIFISSIKVNGEHTLPNKPFRADDTPAPVEPYSVSKYEAEVALQKLASESGMEVVIIRPPLVYGPGVKANFLSLLHWLSKQVPLPLGAIHTKRSLVAIGNLVDLIITCIDHPAAANQIFLVSDGCDMSMTQLLTSITAALGKKNRLLPVPQSILVWVAKVLKQDAIVQRICGALQVDITKNYDLLGWTPPIDMDRALRRTVSQFLDEQAK